MEQTKLIKLLKLLNKEEFKALGNFTESPFFNNLRNVIKLYYSLKEFYPHFKGRDFTRVKLYNQIFPSQKYNDNKLRALFSYLFTLTEKFLAFKKYSTDELRVRTDIARELSNTGNRKLIKENLEKLEIKLNEHNIKDEEYYYRYFQYVSEKNVFHDHFSREKNFPEEVNNLTLYFIISFLKIYRTGFNNIRSVVLDFNPGLEDDILSIAGKEPFINNPAVKIHYNLFKLLKYDDEKYFFEHLKLIEKYPDVLSPDELLESLIELLNFCVLKVQKGFSEFARHKFNLYKFMLEKGYIPENRFSYIFYNNIVTSSLEMGEYEWSQRFMQDYKGHLEHDYREDTVNMCYAKLNYYLKDYDKAMEYLSRCGNLDNIYYRLALKDIHLKILYELKYYDSIFSAIDSFRHYLTKNKFLARPVKEKYKLYLKMMDGLVKAKSSGKQKQTALFKEKIELSEPFLNKDWISEKINENNQN